MKIYIDATYDVLKFNIIYFHNSASMLNPSISSALATIILTNLSKR
jgi:hypothetical protein